MVKTAFKNALTRVITRILYIIIFAFLVLFISSFFNIGLINVYALEPTDEDYKFPIDMQVYDNSTIVNKGGIRSNVFTNDNTSILNKSNFYVYSTYDLSYCEQYEASDCHIRNSPTPGYYDFPYDEQIALPYSSYEDSTGWVGSFYFSFAPDMEVKENNHYSFLYILKKIDSNNNLRYNSNNSFVPQLSAINFTNINGLEYNVLNSVENLTYTSNLTYVSQGVQNKYYYIKIDFDVPNLSIFNNNDNLYLSSIYFDVNEPQYTISIPFDFLINYNPNTIGQLTQGVYFIENGSLDYIGSDCYEGICSGGGGGHSFDGVTDRDIAVLKGIEVCSDTISSLSDLGCHIKRVFDIMYRFFVRAGNFFQDLFDDSVSFDLDTNSDMTPVSNLLTMPLTLINAFLNGVDDSCSSYMLGSLYGHNLTLPCINIENYLGSTLFGIIDALCSIFMIFNVGSLIITFFDRTTSLDDMFGLLYHVRDYQIKQADDDANGVVR